MKPVDILGQLIAIPSVSGDEQRLANFIAGLVHQNTHLIAECIGDNIVIHIKGQNRSRCLIFNGHIDTVEAGDRGIWQSDPFKLTKRGGLLYGLGASDMKGGDAVMLHMISIFADTPPPCDLIFMFVTDEETTGDGTKATLAALSDRLKKYDDLAAIIAEPTDSRVVIGHRGNIFARVDFEGIGAHASTPPPHEKQALLKSVDFIQSIRSKEQEWAKPGNGILGPVTVSVTRVDAGSRGSANQIPTKSSVLLDIRTNELVHKNMVELLQEWCRDFDAQLTIVSQCGIGYCEPNEALVQVALEANKQSSCDVAPSSTDQCFFTELAIPTIILGPGTHGCIHAPNEYVAEQALNNSIEQFGKIISGWAKSSK